MRKGNEAWQLLMLLFVISGMIISRVVLPPKKNQNEFMMTCSIRLEKREK
jgi:hypothetical protein